jgi:hypothetical protein
MPDNNGAALIAVERQRQINREGYDYGHDDAHSEGELLAAAACYLTPPVGSGWGPTPPLSWPWEPEAWKPKDRISDLVRAGALIAAEIDRLQRGGKVRR